MRSALARLVLAAALSGASPAPAAPAVPHASWTKAALSNGFAAAVFDTAAGKLTDLFPHPFAEASAGVVTPDLLWDVFFGVAQGAGAKGTWLDTLPVVSLAYRNGTGILIVVRQAGALELTERWFAPLHADAPAVVGLLTIRNTGGASTAPLTAFSLHNLHVGPDSDTPPQAGNAGEQIAWDPDTRTFRETDTLTTRMGLVRALAPPSRHQAAVAPGPYAAVTSAGALTGSDGAGPADDVVSAFQWDVGVLAAGASRTVGFVIAVSDGSPADPLAGAPADLSGTDPDAVLAAEEAAWLAFHDRDALPDTLVGDDYLLARHSLAMLAMAQVREPTSGDRRPYGQILASLPPGQWNRTWVRDQSYATVALAAAGHAAEASRAIRFVLAAKAGTYAAQVGRAYGVSVCRYYGDGAEESDSNTDGPNIEFDGFGLLLWSLRETAARPGSGTLAADAWPAARDGAAKVLQSLVEPGGLVRPDSGIWEEHWNGKQKHFANTDATAVAGLCAAADLAEGAGEAGEPYRVSARAIASAMSSRLVTPANLLADSTEDLASKPLDGAVVEAFNLGVLDPAGPVATATLNRLVRGLGVASGHGLRRNDDGGWYDRQEWIFVDLRTALALRHAGRSGDAAAIAGWVRAQSRANLDLVAELYDETTADYQGAVPMGGFGAGAWLLWALDPTPATDVAACLRPPAPADDAVPDSPGDPVPDGSVGDAPDGVAEPAPDAAPDVPEPSPDPAVDAADGASDAVDATDTPDTPDANDPGEAISPDPGRDAFDADAVDTSPGADPDTSDADPPPDAPIVAPGSAAGGCAQAATRAPLPSLLLVAGILALGAGLRGTRPRRPPC